MNKRTLRSLMLGIAIGMAVGLGVYAPQEAARILGESINFSRQGQNAMQGNTQPASQLAPQAQKTAHQYR